MARKVFGLFEKQAPDQLIDRNIKITGMEKIELLAGY